MEQQRLQSLDALRGFDMLFIMGGSSFFVALSKFLPASIGEAIASQMEHTAWSGFTFYDMIFPLFLFIAGISFPYSLSNQQAKGIPRKTIYLRILKRGFILVLLGIVYNGALQLAIGEIRFASVLARIGIAWMVAALIFMDVNRLGRGFICAFILIGYWLLLAFVPSPEAGGADPFSMEGSIVGYIDRIVVPGRLHLTIHDPEGFMSTFPAIVSAMLGMFAGELVKSSAEKLTPMKKVGWLLLAGFFLCIAGKAWDVVFPINKNLWTSSFTCYVGVLSMILFAVFYMIIDVWKYRKWTLFFTVIGLNSITIYLAQRIINFDGISKFFLGGIIKFLPENLAFLVSSIGYIAVCWGFLYFLYKKKIFLKV